MSVEDFVMGTDVAAFARGPTGTITAWNEAAEAVLAMSARAVVGKPCCMVLKGSDELGAYCCENCPTWRAAKGGYPVPPYRIQVREGRGGRRAVTVEILVVVEDDEVSLIHLLKPLDQPGVDVAP